LFAPLSFASALVTLGLRRHFSFGAGRGSMASAVLAKQGPQTFEQRLVRSSSSSSAPAAARKAPGNQDPAHLNHGLVLLLLAFPLMFTLGVDALILLP
jgi:hypothetical protein